MRQEVQSVSDATPVYASYLCQGINQQKVRRQDTFFKYQPMLSSIIFSTSSFLMSCKQQIGYLNSIILRPGVSQLALVVKNLPANVEDVKDLGLIPESGRSSWRRVWQITPVFLPRESHGQRILKGYSPQGRKEMDMTE